MNTISYDLLPNDISAKECLWKLLNEYEFESVLDLGAGFGNHSKVLCEHGKQVTAINGDLTQPFEDALKRKLTFVMADYLAYEFSNQFQCIWMAHILENQRNIGYFLNKVYTDLEDWGILAVTVPCCELLAGGGHVSCFTTEHLIYHLVLSGFDLSSMRSKMYYGVTGESNLSIICQKNPKFIPSESNHSDCALLDRSEQLPAYVIQAINAFKSEHPSAWGGHERIMEGVDYKW